MNTPLRIAWIVGLVMVITIVHYSTDAEAWPVHEFLARAYYLPIVLAGLWFGVRGGLITAFVICVAYFPHAVHGWDGPYSFFFRFLEMVMYHILGGLTGYLASRVQKALRAERQARRDRETAYEHLRQKTEELFTLEEQLRRSDRLAALGRLSAGLAHEIRNPLGSIQTSVEMLRQKEPQESREEGEGEAPDFLSVISEETERLNKILGGFLDFARQEKSQPDEEPNATQIEESVQRTRELIRPHLEKSRIDINYHSSDSELTAAITSSHLRQVLLNLFLNSLDAMEDGGKIDVSARSIENNQVEIIVSDSGPGIPEDQIGKVFDPFFSTSEGGTGLGLSIVERIITSHGGSITLDKSHLPTSTFRIILQAAPAS